MDFIAVILFVIVLVICGYLYQLIQKQSKVVVPIGNVTALTTVVPASDLSNVTAVTAKQTSLTFGSVTNVTLYSVTCTSTVNANGSAGFSLPLTSMANTTPRITTENGSYADGSDIGTIVTSISGSKLVVSFVANGQDIHTLNITVQWI